MGGVAYGVIEKVHRLTYVHDDWDVGAVRMTEARFLSRAEMENIAVDKGDVSFLSDILLVPDNSCVVESNDDFVLVDQGSALVPHEDPTVPDDRTRSVLLGSGKIESVAGKMTIKRALD